MVAVLTRSIKRFGIFEFFWISQIDQSASAQFVRLIEDKFMLLMIEPLLSYVLK